jgi:hypothetical protein
VAGDAEVAVARARAGSQLLHRPACAGGVAGLVGRLLAVQAQDVTAFPLALRARAAGLTAAALTEARDDRSVVRAWGPRGTLHLVAAEDLAWLVPLFGPPRMAGSRRRAVQEGIADPDAAAPVVDRILDGAGPLTKEELGERLRSAGVPAEGQGILHLAALAAFAGRLVLGPERGGKPTYVHAGDWLGAPVAMGVDRPRALRELARRYVAAHAPAVPEDLATWSGLPLRDVRAAWTAIADALTGAPHAPEGWRLRSRRLEAPADVVRLLPGYDELLLGWRSRAPVLAEAHGTRAHPGGGVIRATLVVDGRVVATWRTRRSGARMDVLVTPFSDRGLPAAVLTALEAEAADMAGFLGQPVTVVVDGTGG